MERPMLFWLGLSLLAAGCLAFAVDRRAAHFFHDELHQRWAAIVHRTTDWAKGSHWLVIACLAYGASWLLARLWGPMDSLLLMRRTSLAFLVSLVIGSIILHSIKVVLGRRRPRDELELGLYGFRPFHFDLQYDSFPSGHALTIFCVATAMTGAEPQLTWLWVVVAVYLAMTRALLNSHYLSDICVGAGIAILVTREVILTWFQPISQPWF
jgi:membrane-associated phospholipid phosphatase